MIRKFLFLIILEWLTFNFQSFGQSGNWTWIHGSSTTVNSGNFGVQGIPSPSNEPPSLYEPCEWKDLNGNFWMFGGTGVGQFADLWKYDPVANEWTWMKGPGTTSFVGNWGTIGVSSASNNPSSRSHGMASWVDNSGHLWMFGGMTGSGLYCDLWKFDISSNEWTWIKGPNTSGQTGLYGSVGIPDTNNYPAARRETSIGWTDNAGDLWLFGGYGSGGGLKNDLWRFNITSNTWTWMKGSSGSGQAGVYGIQGIEAVANTPGARMVYCRWKDVNGNLWLFGGGDYFGNNYYNDLWRFNPSTNNWAWMKGSLSANANGIFGTQCDTSTINGPDARFENRISWNDQYGNFWTFGGGRDGSLSTNWNDLWMYCISSNEWEWIKGSSSSNPSGNWGTLGVSSPLNTPNGRAGAIGWNDFNGHLYFFGGVAGNVSNSYNDLWKFDIDYGCVDCDGFFLSNSCLGDSTYFSSGNVSVLFGSAWNFGDTASGINNLSNNFNPVHLYGDTGLYNVQLILYFTNGSIDTTYRQVRVNGFPQISLGNDTSICSGSSILLNAGSGYSTYLWQDGSNDSTFLATTSGAYFVTVSQNGCSTKDTVNIYVISCSAPGVNFYSSDTNFCDKHCIDFFDISTNNPTSWQWLFPGADSLSSTEQNPTGICYSAYGSFDVTLIACNASGCDTLHLINFVNEYQAPSVPVITSNFDTLFSTPAFAYQWYNSSGIIAGATNSYYVYQQPGSYYVFVTDSNGCASSSVVIYTSVSELDANDIGIFINPNPNNGHFELVCNKHSCEVESCMVYDVIGRILLHSERLNISGDWKIDLNSPANGVYFLQIKTAAKIWNKKIIVNR